MLVKMEEEPSMDYQMKMVCQNTIHGLCPMSVRQFNNESILYYDISGRISIKHMYMGNKMTAPDFRDFILGLQKMLESMKEYLLDINKILMDFEYIYTDSEKKMLFFCYYPEKTEDFFTSLHKVLNTVIEFADHTDKETVIFSYGLQRLGSQENITISELVKFASGSRKSEEKEALTESYYIENKRKGMAWEHSTAENEEQEVYSSENENYRIKTHERQDIFGRIKEFFIGRKKQI